MTIEEKILTDIEEKRVPCTIHMLPEYSRGKNAALSEAQSIITKHLQALSVEDVAQAIRDADNGENGMYDIARAVLALIRRDV